MKKDYLYRLHIKSYQNGSSTCEYYVRYRSNNLNDLIERASNINELNAVKITNKQNVTVWSRNKHEHNEFNKERNCKGL